MNKGLHATLLQDVLYLEVTGKIIKLQQDDENNCTHTYTHLVVYKH